MQEVKKTRVELPEEMVNYLQMLSYEANGLMVLHTHAMASGVSREKLEELRELFHEKYTEYRLAAQEVASEHTAGKAGRNWYIDFAEGVLYFEE